MKEQTRKNKGLPWSFDMKESNGFFCIPNARQDSFDPLR